MPSTHNMRNPDSTRFKLSYLVTLKLDQHLKNITMTRVNFSKNNLLLCYKQKQQEYNHLYDKMCAKHSNNTVTYYMNIIQNKY